MFRLRVDPIEQFHHGLLVWSGYAQSSKVPIDLSRPWMDHADRLQPALNALTPQITGAQAVNSIKSQPFTVANANGQQQNLSLPASAAAEAQQLVIYAQPSKDPPSGLEFRLAWEIDVTNGPIKKVYLDAVSGEIIATS